MPVLPDSLQPDGIVIPNEGTRRTENLPMLQEWAYDFEENELLVNENGLPYLVEGNEALKIWLFWAVTSERYRWPANSKDYGTEIEKMIGLPVTTAIKSSELERTIRESIEICEYVKEIDYIRLSLNEGKVNVDVKLKSIYNEGWVQLSVTV